MKSPIFAAMFASALLLAGCQTPYKTQPAPGAATANVAGQWHWVCCDGNYKGEMTLQQDAGKVSGRFFDENDTTGAPIEGSVGGNTVSFTRAWADNLRQDFTLTLSADGQKLEGKFTGTQDTTFSTQFEATRK